MSALEQITLIVPPSAELEGPRQFHQYDKFADQLRPHTSALVEIVEDDFATPPADGVILLHRYGTAAFQRGANSSEEENEMLSEMWPPELRRRIFCLGVNRGNPTLAMLERLDLAGAIDSIDYEVGVREMGFETSYGASGLYGVRPIAESLGCRIDYGADRYCKTVVPPFKSLGELLGRYLDAYWSTIS